LLKESEFGKKGCKTRVLHHLISRGDNFAPPFTASPHTGFSPLHKGGGIGMWRDFSPAPLGRAGMCLDFLDPTHLVLPHLAPPASH